MKKDKYYEIKDFENIHIIIGQKGYGKTYYETKNLIKEKMLKDKKSFEKQIINLELIDSEDCILYRCYASLCSYIDNFIEFLENNNEIK